MPEYKVTVMRVDGTESTTTMKVQAENQKEALERVSHRVGAQNFEDKIYTQNPGLRASDRTWLGVGYSDGTTG